nr:S8 family serine peptidase [Candidatus Parabeggiatoa sp.]
MADDPPVSVGTIKLPASALVIQSGSITDASASIGGLTTQDGAPTTVSAGTVITITPGTGALVMPGGIAPSGSSTTGTITLPGTALTMPVAAPMISPKLDSTLANLASAATISIPTSINLAQSQSLALSGERVQVQLVTHSQGINNAISSIIKAGGKVTGVGNNNTVIQAWVPLNALNNVASEQDVYAIRRPAEFIPFATTEALDDTYVSDSNVSDDWHDAGFTGKGIKVGIIDVGFTSYKSLLGTELPNSNSVIVKNFVDSETDSQVDGSYVHGTACAEIIHDIAPNATLYLAKVARGLDIEEAVGWMKQQSVDIISSSIGSYNETPGDGTGTYENLVKDARSKGILWFTAASNDRLNHWGGIYTDTDSNGYHEFVTGTQNKEINFFGPGNGTAYTINADVSIKVYVRWDDWKKDGANNPTSTQDYNLLLVRWNGSSLSIVASSTNLQNGLPGQFPTEFVEYTTTGVAAAYGILIQRVKATRNVNFEVFAPKMLRFDEIVFSRSLANLSDAKSAVTVAAVDVNPSYPQESYSSEGPTNGPGGSATGGLTKPDISGYANVTTKSAGKFNGTSAATPHTAGAAALVMEAFPNYSLDQVQKFLETNAIDLGSSGMDSKFGYGRLFLGAVVDDLPCESPVGTAKTVTIKSVGNGNWNNASTWNLNRVPNSTDVVLVGKHQIMNLPAKTNVNVLCNYGELWSRADASLKIQAPGGISNYATGVIKGQDGANAPGNCNAGKDVILQTAKSVKNFVKTEDDYWWYTYEKPGPITNEGQILGGMGENGTSCAGKGGEAVVLGRNVTNTGKIEGGKGGNANNGKGGEGGRAQVFGRFGGSQGGSSGNLRSTGTIRGGNGGNGGNGTSGGDGGNLWLVAYPNVYLGGTYTGGCWKCGSINRGEHKAGSGGSPNGKYGWITVEPLVITIDEGTDIKGGDITIFGGDDTILNLGTTIESTGNVTLAVGKNGTVDLTGDSASIKASGEVKVLADDVKMNAGTTLSEVIQASKIETGPGKILHEVSLTGATQVSGLQGATLSVRLVLANGGPVLDTYILSVSDSEGWTIGKLPPAIKVAELSSVGFGLDVTLPSTASATDVITITATSQADSEVSATMKVQVAVTTDKTAEDGNNDEDKVETVATNNDATIPTIEVPSSANDNIGSSPNSEIIPIGEVGDNTTPSDGNANTDSNANTNNDSGNTDGDESQNDDGNSVIIGNYTVSGTLLNELGEAIVGATIQVADKQTLTNSAGNWAITGLPEGTHQTTMTL